MIVARYIYIYTFHIDHDSKQMSYQLSYYQTASKDGFLLIIDTKLFHQKDL